MDHSLENAPASIRQWAAKLQNTVSAGELKDLLADDVKFEFAGKTLKGRDAVLAQIAGMPTMAAKDGMELSVQPESTADYYVVRATGPGGKPLPGPGGPLVAMDFKLTLNEAQLLKKIQPVPYHLEPAQLPTPAKPGDKVAPFTLPDATGQEVTFTPGDYAASAVIFTCNVCPWALGWHDRIQDVIRDFQTLNVGIVQINANDPAVSPKDSVAYSKQRVDSGQFAGPYLLDQAQVVAKQLGGRHTPDVFVLDKEGIVVYHGAPDANYEDEALQAAWLRGGLQAALGHTTPTPTFTEPIGCTIKWTL